MSGSIPARGSSANMKRLILIFFPYVIAVRNPPYQNRTGQSLDFRETEQPPSYHLLVDYEVIWFSAPIRERARPIRFRHSPKRVRFPLFHLSPLCEFPFFKQYWREIVHVTTILYRTIQREKSFLSEAVLGKFQIGSSAAKCSNFGKFQIFLKFQIFCVRKPSNSI